MNWEHIYIIYIYMFLFYFIFIYKLHKGSRVVATGFFLLSFLALQCTDTSHMHSVHRQHSQTKLTVRKLVCII